MPPAVSVELTNHCNLKCPECPSGSGIMTREKGFMNIDLFRRVIAELNPCLFYLNLWFQGEPMLHPDFFSFLEVTGSFRKVISTNGHFLSEESAGRLVRSDLAKLIISLDGMDQETYAAYRRQGDLGRVIEGIRNVVQARMKHNSPLKIEIQFLVNRINEHQIPEVRNFADGIKASLRLKSMQVLSNERYRLWLPGDNRFRRYEESDGAWKIRSSLPRRCSRIWLNPVITWDGKVVPCCFDKNADHIMGDLAEQSFSEIWNGQEFNNFRRRILSLRPETGICRNCTEGLKKSIKV